MPRRSPPWDDPDPDRHRTGLPSNSPGKEVTPASEDVMASIDGSASRSELVIADVSRENAWLSVDEQSATVLKEWC
jgi:hypothetical protein